MCNSLSAERVEFANNFALYARVYILLKYREGILDQRNLKGNNWNASCHWIQDARESPMGIDNAKNRVCPSVRIYSCDNWPPNYTVYICTLDFDDDSD